jgi:PadR family transcriptional regulator PadR
MGISRRIACQAGWLTSSWSELETNRRARFYRLTKTSRGRLDAESERWERISLAMASAFRAT